MTDRIYIDPGKLSHACAYFEGPRLLWVDSMPPEDFDNTASWALCRELLIEKPQIYPGSDEKDPNDCLDVFGAARYAEALIHVRGGPAAVYVKPREWKGGLKKPQHHRLVWGNLTSDERDVFARDAKLDVDFIGNKIEEACERFARTRKVTGYKWQAHNLLDAVGLGLWHLRRVHSGQRIPPALRT